MARAPAGGSWWTASTACCTRSSGSRYELDGSVLLLGGVVVLAAAIAALGVDSGDGRRAAIGSVGGGRLAWRSSGCCARTCPTRACWWCGPFAVAGAVGLAVLPPPARSALTVVTLFALGVALTIYPGGGGVEWGGRFFSPVTVPLAVGFAVLVDRGRALAPEARRATVGALAVAALVVVGFATTATRGARDGGAEVEQAVLETGATVALTPNGLLPSIAWRAHPEVSWIIVGDGRARPKRRRGHPRRARVGGRPRRRRRRARRGARAGRPGGRADAGTPHRGAHHRGDRVVSTTDARPTRALPLALHVLLLAAVVAVAALLTRSGGVVSADEGAMLAELDLLDRTGEWSEPNPEPVVDPELAAPPLELSDRTVEGRWAPFAKHPVHIALLRLPWAVGGHTAVLAASLASVVVAAVGRGARGRPDPSGHRGRRRSGRPASGRR